MSKVNDVPYAVRNDICTRLNKSTRGMFLDDILRRGSIHALKIANSPKLTSGLVKFLKEHSALLVRKVESTESGSKRWWIVSTKKEMDRNPPQGYVFVDESEPERDTVVEQPAQSAKYDPRPEPSPVVYSTKPVEQESVFDVLRKPTEEVTRTEEPVVVISEQQAQEKEPEMTAASSALTQAALLRRQAEEMTALAANLEREDSALKRLEELRPVQLEIARATAVLHRASGEMIDAMEILEKASEKLRVLVNAR